MVIDARAEDVDPLADSDQLSQRELDLSDEVIDALTDALPTHAYALPAVSFQLRSKKNVARPCALSTER